MHANAYCTMTVSTSMPFDDSTGIGYFTSYVIQITGSASICAIIYTVNSLFFGVCWYVRTLLFDLHSIFVQINELYEKRDEHRNCDGSNTIHNNKVDGKRTKMHSVNYYSLLRNYVREHNKIIRYNSPCNQIQNHKNTRYYAK